MKAPITVKKIFWTAYAPRIAAKVAPAMIVENMISSASVPRFAGRIPLSATEAA